MSRLPQFYDSTFDEFVDYYLGKITIFHKQNIFIIKIRNKIWENKVKCE